MMITEYTSTSIVTRKGQITIPAHIRRLLKVKPRDKVAFIVSRGKIEIAPAQSVVRATAGMLASGHPRLSTEEEHAAFEKALCDAAQEKGD